MLTKSQIRFIKSLQLKKYRKEEQSFLVQGAKSIHEILHSDWEIRFLAGTADFLDSLKIPAGIEIIEAKPSELEAVGEFQSNEAGILVAAIRPEREVPIALDSYSLVLDNIRDPGNLGTIIRTADWYGIETIYASPTTTDFYNPKVITATMGSFTRVQVCYTSLPELLSGLSIPVYGAMLGGPSVYKEKYSPAGVLVIGNESHGISPEVLDCITHQVTIPRIGHAESLNASIATAILLDNLVGRH